MKGVAKAYPHFRLDDIGLDLPRGSIMGFIGPNGAGKSTTIRIAMGLVHQDRGDVRVLGHAMPRDQVAGKREVGFFSEDMRLYKRSTLEWHMGFVRSIYPEWDDDYAQRLVRRFDLRPGQKLKGYSPGQRVKAGLLLVLARRPRLLVLDEPTTGLDPVAREEVLGELMEVLRDDDRSILFSSHNTLDVEQISDKVTFIDRGRIIDSSDKETYLDRWRRLRLELPAEATLPVPAGLVDVQQNGRLAVVTTNDFREGLARELCATGASVRDVVKMSLEEIFVATVAYHRGGEAR